MSEKDKTEMTLEQFIDWKRLFTGLLLTGILGVVSMLIVASSLSSDVEDLSGKVDSLDTKIESLATKNEVEDENAQTLKAAKTYTNEAVSGMKNQLDSTKITLEAVSEDVKEMKKESREDGRETQETLQEIAKELKRLQIDQARGRP